jgi:ABC-type multidrug transport system fused ATPase/permease subunit
MMIRSDLGRSVAVVCCASSSVSSSATAESVGVGGSDILDPNEELGRKPVWSYFIPMRRTFPLIEPFIYTEVRLILQGWVCTAIAVGALFLSVPQIGNLSNLLSKGDMQRLVPKAGVVLTLVMVRSIAQFWQQAFLWEAALKITYKLRAHVYERVLKRDLDYFEGGESGAATGDVAFRLTAEAEDVGDTVHSLLHVREIMCLV